MTPEPLTTRELVVAEARTWVGTPYHRNARIKGAGVDCATLLFCVYRNCGLIESKDEGMFADEKLVPVGDDWFHHTTEERYMKMLLRYAHFVAKGIAIPTLAALPGNLILTRAVGARVYNHGGIVIKWPAVIHACYSGAEIINATSHQLWDHQDVTVFDPWVKP